MTLECIKVMDAGRRGLVLGGTILAGAIASGLLPTMCSMVSNQGMTGLNRNAAPQRPPGNPAPPLDEDIAPIIARLEAWYAAHLRPDKYTFNPPASEAEIGRLADLISVELPASYRQLYRWHDGENDDRWGHFFGLPLLPLRLVRDEWLAWQRVLADFDGDRYLIPGAGWPAGAVDPAYVNLRRVALTADGSGNSIGLDFDPWPNGRVGQVIIFGRDQDVKVVIAESLGGFLEWIATLLEEGNFRIGAAPGETVLREFRLKSPATHDFHDGARELLGAPGPFL